MTVTYQKFRAGSGYWNTFGFLVVRTSWLAFLMVDCCGLSRTNSLFSTCLYSVGKRNTMTRNLPRDQGYGRGVPPIFTAGSMPKNGIPLVKAAVGGVPPIFTTGSTPKKGIPLIKATVGGYPQF